MYTVYGMRVVFLQQTLSVLNGEVYGTLQEPQCFICQKGNCSHSSNPLACSECSLTQIKSINSGHPSPLLLFYGCTAVVNL
jgi:hypothetical protein